MGGLMHIYRHHIGDYDSATAHLDWVEDMAYTRILRLYYKTDGNMPKESAAICRLIRASSKTEKAAVETILSEFFILTDEGWKNKRADEEIAEYQARAEKNREHGKKGGRPRTYKTEAVNSENPDGFSLETQMVSEKKPTKNQEPRTNNQEPICKNKKHLSTSVDAAVVFDHWRSRMNHPKAQLDRKRSDLIGKAIGLGYTPEDLMTAIDGCARSEWHMGMNDRGTVFDDIGLILRDAGKIDQFIKLASQQGVSNAAHQHANTKPRTRVEVVAGYLFGTDSGPTGKSQEQSQGGLQGAAAGAAPRIFEHVPDTGTG
jgi:uncharacterized protein YdaU (DUF1376 family)